MKRAVMFVLGTVALIAWGTLLAAGLVIVVLGGFCHA